jgi:hypothetical protein
MTRKRAVVTGILAGVLAATASCAPTAPEWSASGLWRPRIGGGSGAILSIQHSGSFIAGRACYIADATVVFRNVPVSGRFPAWTFTVAPEHVAEPRFAHFAGIRYDGTSVDRDLMVGEQAVPPGEPPLGTIAFIRTATLPAGCAS